MADKLQKQISEIKTNVKESLENLIQMLDMKTPNDMDKNFCESVKLFFILEEKLTKITTYLQEEKEKYIELENNQKKKFKVLNDRELVLKAYIPSAMEYKKYFKKFRAIMGAKLSIKAKEHKAWECDKYCDKGYFLMRTPLVDSTSHIAVGGGGGVLCWDLSYRTTAGLRVAFRLKYDTKSSVVKSCRMLKQTSLVYENNEQCEAVEKGKKYEVTSAVPIIIFGGKECIWLNKEECENGQNETMELWTLELLDCAKPFYKDNDFGNAIELQKQCYKELTIGCNDEELNMVVGVKMSKEDNYEKVEPII